MTRRLRTFTRAFPASTSFICRSCALHFSFCSSEPCLVARLPRSAHSAWYASLISANLAGASGSSRFTSGWCSFAIRLYARFTASWDAPGDTPRTKYLRSSSGVNAWAMMDVRWGTRGRRVVRTCVGRTDGETPAFIAAVAVNTRMAHDICDDIAASWITHGQSQLLSDCKS